MKNFNPQFVINIPNGEYCSKIHSLIYIEEKTVETCTSKTSIKLLIVILYVNSSKKSVTTRDKKQFWTSYSQK